MKKLIVSIEIIALVVCFGFILNTYHKRNMSLEEAAEAGDPGAQVVVGNNYFQGRGVEKDWTKAEYWWKKSAQQKWPMGQYDLGILYLNQKQIKAAVELFRLAAEQGLPQAQYSLGERYLRGEGVEVNYKEAEAWYRKAADQNYVDAQRALGRLYAKGDGERYFNRNSPTDSSNTFSPNLDEAIKLLQAAIKNGDVNAYSELGDIYYEGKTAAQDFGKAEEYYRQGVEHASRQAMYMLGNMLFLGKNGKQDYLEAERLFRLAADKGDGWSQYSLGMMYFTGTGVSQNYQEAERWLKLSAESDKNAFAYEKLGEIYYRGLNGKRDYQEAAKFFEASRCHPFSAFYLAKMKILGEYAETDLAGAEKYLVNVNYFEENLDKFSSAIRMAPRQESADFMKPADKWVSFIKEGGDIQSRYSFNETYLVELCWCVCGSLLHEAEKWFTVAKTNGDPKADFYLAHLTHFSSEKERYKYIKSIKSDDAAVIEAELKPFSIKYFECLDVSRNKYNAEVERYNSRSNDDTSISKISVPNFEADEENCLKSYEAELVKLAASSSVRHLYTLALEFQNKNNTAEAENYFRQASEKGVIEASYELGNLAFSRNEFAKAKEYFMMAAEKGDPWSQFSLGMIAYLDKDYVQAIAWFRKAADQNLIFAQARLGEIYYKGLGVNRDYKAAEDLYTKAQQDPAAAFYLAKMYLLGEGVSPDPVKAEAVLQNVVTFQNNLAQNIAIISLSDWGKDRGKDNLTIDQWKEFIQDKKDFYSKYTLGDIFSGVERKCARLEQNPKKEAQKWYRYDAKNGNPRALFCLANMLRYRSPAESEQYFSQAAAKGVTQAAGEVARAVESRVRECELEVSKKYKAQKEAAKQSKDPEALFKVMEQEDAEEEKCAIDEKKAIEEAAAANDAMSQLKMARTFQHGKNKDAQQAEKWFKLAAEQGESLAQMELGELYYYGLTYSSQYQEDLAKLKSLMGKKGNADLAHYYERAYKGGQVPQNLPDAHKWLERAVSSDRISGNTANYYLGEMYYFGRGVSQDLNKAQEYFAKHFNQGQEMYPSLRNSAFYLGLITNDRSNPQKDLKAALQYLDNAAQKDNEPAKGYLAHLYYAGYGISQDKDKARQLIEPKEKYYPIGSDLGKAILGLIDPAKKKPWERNALESLSNGTDGFVQGYIAIAYAQGIGIDRNGVEAEKWKKSAKENGIDIGLACDRLEIDQDIYSILGTLKKQIVYQNQNQVGRCQDLLDDLARFSVEISSLRRQESNFRSEYGIDENQTKATVNSVDRMQDSDQSMRQLEEDLARHRAQFEDFKNKQGPVTRGLLNLTEKYSNWRAEKRKKERDEDFARQLNMDPAELEKTLEDLEKN